MIFVLSGLRVVKEWERAPVFRFGRFIGLKGPGIFWILPGIDNIQGMIRLPDSCPVCRNLLEYTAVPASENRIEIGCPSGHHHIIKYETHNGSVSIEQF
ncbi:MAG: hypothetical protein ACFFE8_06245 [Candidatus Heimdallarchaeota archaeon]